jgi:hypothetical protein
VRDGLAATVAWFAEGSDPDEGALSR